MPFLRVLRDKRGYETTYLMHLFREGDRQRSRVLYVFRGPAGSRVGRMPLEPDVLQAIERQYPDVAFDWDAVLDQQQVIEAAPEIRRRKPRREDRETAPAPAHADPPPAARREAPAADASVPPPRTAIPATLEGTTPDEQIAFLDRVYLLVRERIAQRGADAVRRDVLSALAERLNSAAWTDADQISSGLQGAAEALERLSRVFARRRRRGRKRPDASGETAAEPVEAPDAAAMETESEEPEDPSRSG